MGRVNAGGNLTPSAASASPVVAWARGGLRAQPSVRGASPTGLGTIRPLLVSAVTGVAGLLQLFHQVDRAAVDPRHFMATWVTPSANNHSASWPGPD